MSSRFDVTAQQDRSIRMIEHAIEAKLNMLSRQGEVPPVGLKASSHLTSTTGGARSTPHGASIYRDAPESGVGFTSTPSVETVRRTGSMTNTPSKPIVFPDIFDGSIDFDDWLANLKLCSEINNWDEDRKAQFLAVKLRGPALQVYADLAEENKGDFEVIVHALKERFSSLGQTNLYRAKLKTRCRRKNEPLPELAGDIGRLVTRAYPNISVEMREEVGKDYFVEALDLPEIRMQVRRAKPESLSEALKVALEEEAFLHIEYKVNANRLGAHACQESSISHSESSEELKCKIDQLQQAVKEIQDTLQSGRFDKKPRKKTWVCWNCNQEGHRQFECPFVPPQVPQPGNSQSKNQEN